jgi:PKD repeat protein
MVLGYDLLCRQIPKTAAYPIEDTMGQPNPVSKRGRILAVATTFAVISSLLAFASPASADTAPPVATDPSTVSSDALATPQINGVVWSQAIVGNVAYVAGNFTSARPYGSAAGTNETPRSYLLAYDVTTGVLLSWAPTLNGQIRQITVSPDKTRLYAVGDFTTVNGATRNRVVAFDLPSGAMSTTFHPSANATTYAVAATNSSVYLGGNFSAMAGASRVGTASVSASTGSAGAWNPILTTGRAFAMQVSPDGTKVVIGGAFVAINGSDNPGYGLGMVDAVTGSNLPFGSNSLVRDGGAHAAIFSLASDADSIYGTGYVFGAGGNLEGTFRSDWNGNLQWVEDCHGDEYSVAVQDQTVYIAGHPHYCGNVGSFPQTEPNWTFHRALAFSKQATGTITHDPNGYYDFAGTASPTPLNWFPDINLGTFTGQFQGPWSIAASSTYVIYGGEFTTVNGKAQQGLVRFASKAVAPNLDGPRLSGNNLMPTVQSAGSTSMTVSWPADWDRDNELLNYQVYRDGKTATAAYTTAVSSRFWNQPTISWIDTGLTPGSTHTYRLRATDAFGNSAWGTTVSGTVATATTLSPYAAQVINDQPTDFWRLGEAAGAASATDSVGRYVGTVGTGVTYGTPGSIVGDSTTAATFDGTSNGLVASSGQVWGSNTFSIETWINTTSSSGGKIIGFGNNNTGTSSSYDRHVYMNAQGNLLFGVYPNSPQVVQSAKTYNDGQWHHVVATLGTSGMQLYVDGLSAGYNASVTTAQNYWGYWRIGGDSSWSGDNFIKGSIGNTAIYPIALTKAQIQNHYTLSGRTVNQPVAPADAYGAAVFNLDPTLYYRLGESSGSVAKDSGQQGNPGIYDGNVTLGTPGAVRGTADTSALFTDGGVASGAASSGTTTYSTQIWFNTTTTNGGKLTGFGSSQTGNSSSYDRHVYMQNDGTLVFGTYTGQLNTVTSPLSYNDGKWHMATATQSSAGMKLYVDDGLVGTNPQTNAQDYTGYWRAGNDVTWGSNSNNFNGQLDEFAVYPTALDASTVSNLYALGKPLAANILPTAAFTATSTGMSVALDASASADSDGTIATYAWDFGDGSMQTPSATATASHVYATPGTYTVTLTVVDNSGGSATTTHLATPVHVNQLPVAIFTSSSNNLAASFDATGSSDPDGTIASYAWDFGDGSTGAGATVNHSYATANTFTVTLTVVDNSGGSTVLSHPITVQAANQLPTASLSTSNTAGSLAVGVDASASNDPDGTISSYDVDYGDSTTHGTTATSTHTYAVAGTYTIGLVVTDNRGGIGTTTKAITVTKTNIPPVASFTNSASNLALSVNAAASTDPDGTITSYAWDFGDTGTATGITASHSYAAAGTYAVTLTVTDNQSATTSTTQSVTVVAAPANTTIAEDHFDRTAISSWGNALTGGAWTINSAASSSVGSGVGVQSHPAGATRKAMLNTTSASDADISTDLSFDKAITGGGAYAGVVARNTSTDYYQSRVRFLADGTMAVQILQGGSTTLANAVVPGTYTPGTMLTLRTQISGTSPTTIKARVWVAGTTEPTAWAVIATSSAAGLQIAGSVGLVSYAASSITNAPLLAKYDNFVASSGTVVTPPPANVAPTAAFTSSVNGLVANLNGGASADSDGTIATYAWDFGDNTTGTGVTATHSYATAGTFTVTLTVTDNGGLTGTKTGTVVATAVVTPPGNPNILASDDFNRTTTSGWGTAVTGGVWTSTPNSNYVVNNGSGALLLAAGSTRRALLNAVSVMDVEVQSQISSDKPPLAGLVVAGLVGRQVGTDFYLGRIRLLPNGVVSLQILHGSTLLADTTIAGLSYTPGDLLNLKVRFTGSTPTTIQAKLWAANATEPTNWQLSATDSTAALQGAGTVGVESYISTSASNAPITVRYDNYTASVPQ